LFHRAQTGEGQHVEAALLNSTQDAVDDPHVQAMGFLKPMTFPNAPCDVPIVDTPFRLSETPVTIRRRALLLGEQTDEVMSEIGYSDAEIAQLRDRGVV
jgi:crotonobetainyl-CoA:carnitine CoA-transferase CaiB-like acyl-CoA transferase